MATKSQIQEFDAFGELVDEFADLKIDDDARGVAAFLRQARRRR